MGLGKKKSTFGNDTSQVFTYDHQNNYLMNFEYFWSSLQYMSKKSDTDFGKNNYTRSVEQYGCNLHYGE